MTRFTSKKGILARLSGVESATSEATSELSSDTTQQQNRKTAPQQPGPSPKKSPKRRRYRYLRYFFWLSLGLIAGGAGAAYWGLTTLERNLPDTADVFTFVRDGTLTIKASDGKIIQQSGPATRDKLPIQKIPNRLVQAFLAVEDRRFYQHDGVDYQGVFRATASNILARDVVEGGSTITQQLARVVFLNQERSAWRKLKEALLARKLEQEMDKEQILERYLNLVYLGSGAYGVADAAWVYFSKPVHKLTLTEMATIAGLPPAPSVYSPLVNPEAALERRDIVLQRMEDAGFITPAEAQTARNVPLGLKPSAPKRLSVEAPYFTTYIQQELPKYVSPEALEIGGLVVETSVTLKWQKIAETVVKEAIELDGPGQGFAQAALVAIDPRNGEVKAMVGGNDFGKSQFNRVTQAQRQPGSTFKALVYTAAIASGQSPYDGYVDAPYSIDGYQPQNASRKYYGWLSLRDALTYSVNVIAVKVLADVGFDPVIKLAKDMGIQSKLKPVYSLALGASEVNLLELTSAYGTLAAQGTHAKVHGIRRILNRRGEVLYDAAQTKPKRVVDKGTAAIMTWMMQGVVQSGTGSNAYLNDRPVAGKTGTSEQARDLWFIGYIPQMVTGVWLGNDDNQPTWGASSTAALVWHQFMVKVVQGMPVQKFPALPTLEGRKGSIKAKPVRGNVTSGRAPVRQEPAYSSPPRSTWTPQPTTKQPEPPPRTSASQLEHAAPNEVMEEPAPRRVVPTPAEPPVSAPEPVQEPASTVEPPPPAPVEEPAPAPVENPPPPPLPVPTTEQTPP